MTFECGCTTINLEIHSLSSCKSLFAGGDKIIRVTLISVAWLLKVGDSKAFHLRSLGLLQRNKAGMVARRFFGHLESYVMVCRISGAKASRSRDIKRSLVAILDIEADASKVVRIAFGLTSCSRVNERIPNGYITKIVDRRTDIGTKVWRLILRRRLEWINNIRTTIVVLTVIVVFPDSHLGIVTGFIIIHTVCSGIDLLVRTVKPEAGIHSILGHRSGCEGSYSGKNLFFHTKPPTNNTY